MSQTTETSNSDHASTRSGLDGSHGSSSSSVETEVEKDGLVKTNGERTPQPVAGNGALQRSRNTSQSEGGQLEDPSIVHTATSLLSFARLASMDDTATKLASPSYVELQTRDVLCGRGRGFFNHPGNRRMLEIVEENKSRYRAAGKKMKTQIVRIIMEQIKEGGTRFLKRKSPASEDWIEVDEDEAHKKVCHCLREQKKVLDKNTNSTESASKRKHANLKGDKGEPPPNTPQANKSRRTSTNNKRPSTVDTAAMQSLHQMRHQVWESQGASTSNSTPSAHNLKTNAPIAPPAPSDGCGKRENIALGPRLLRDVETAPETSTGPPAALLTLLGEAAARRNSVAVSKTATEEQADHPATPAKNQKQPEGNNATSPLTPHPPAESDPRIFHSLPSEFKMRYGIVTEDPQADDVLFGQDPAFYSHPGNVRLRGMIHRSVTFPPSGNETKSILAKGFVSQLKESGCKFLTRQRNGPAGMWFRIEDAEAEKLIFRYLQEEEELKMRSLFAGRQGSTKAAGKETADPSSVANVLASVLGPGIGFKLPSGKESTPNLLLPREGDHSLVASTLSPKATGSENMTRSGIHQSSEVPFIRGEMETTQALGKAGLVPGENDVILGRGRGAFLHTGNKKMLGMFYNNRPRYKAASKLEKANIGKEIVEEIKSRGGRFVVRAENGEWRVVDDKVALRKVCHGIRDIPLDPERRKRSVASEQEVAGDDSIMLPDSTSNANEDSDNNSGPGAPSATSNEKSDNEGLPNLQPAETNLRPPSAMDPILGPRPQDVLCGRGRGHFGHAGNRRMLQIIGKHKARYKAGTKSEKGRIAREIMEEVQSIGARFLKRKERNSPIWVVCSYEDALHKVGHGIRDSISKPLYKKKVSNDSIPGITSSTPPLPRQRKRSAGSSAPTSGAVPVSGAVGGQTEEEKIAKTAQTTPLEPPPQYGPEEPILNSKATAVQERNEQQSAPNVIPADAMPSAQDKSTAESLKLLDATYSKVQASQQQAGQSCTLS